SNREDRSTSFCPSGANWCTFSAPASVSPPQLAACMFLDPMFRFSQARSAYCFSESDPATLDELVWSLGIDLVPYLLAPSDRSPTTILTYFLTTRVEPMAH